MKFLAFFSTIFAILLSVNAAAILKRAAPNVNSCMDNIQAVSTQLDVLGPSVNNGGLLDVRNDYSNFSDAMDAAQGTCCAINTVISEADADEALATLGTLTPKVQKVLSDISIKESDYNMFLKLFVRSHIKSFEEKSQNLNACFTVFTPPSKTATLDGYFHQINTAFQNTKTAYGI